MEIHNHPAHGFPKDAFPQVNWTLFFCEDFKDVFKENSCCQAILNERWDIN